MREKALKERDVERHLIRRVKQLGGEVRKVRWIGRRNAPDRLVLAPGLVPFLLELKRPGKRPTLGQAREMRRLADLGLPCDWADTRERVDAVVADHAVPEASR